MNKLSIISIMLWMVLAIIMIVGQIVGATPFFVLCNDCFAFLNGCVTIALIPMLWQEIKNKKTKNDVM